MKNMDVRLQRYKPHSYINHTDIGGFANEKSLSRIPEYAG
jgi:hypothetical protein